MKDLSEEQRFIGNIRGLLNKITDQTFDKIKTKLEELEFDEDNEQYVKQISDIYIKKITHDSMYTELYAQSGIILCKKFNGIGKEIQQMIGDFFREAVKEYVIEDVTKLKLINLMKWLPYGCEANVINWKITDEIVTERIYAKIKELTSVENSINTYVGAITSEGVGVWIEMACAILGVCAETKRNIEHYQKLLDLITVLKDDREKLKSRIRFMIEDLLILLKNK